MPEQLPGRRAPSQSAVPETLRGGTPNARVSLPPLLRLALRPPGRAEGVPVAGALARPSPPAEGNWTTQRDTDIPKTGEEGARTPSTAIRASWLFKAG